MTDLYSAYLDYLAALCVKRCGLTPHSKELAQYFEQVLIQNHLQSTKKREEFEREGWSIVETFTLVDEHKIDPFLKGLLSIVEIQNLLEQTDSKQQLITVNRSCKPPFPQTWSLVLHPNIDLFSSSPFKVNLKLKIELASPEAPLEITSIENDCADQPLFCEKMEMYKIFHSKN